MSRISSAQKALATIDDLLRALGADPKKYAADHGSPPLSEPGSMGGESEHPTTDAPDGLIELETGERYDENTEDVQEMFGEASIDARPEEKSSGDQTKAPDGTNATATGEDPENETESLDDQKDDSETSHPASTENPEIVTRKYSSMSDESLLSRFAQLGNYILDHLEKGTVSSSTKAAEMDLPEFADPKAADAEVVSSIYELIKSAEAAADRTAAFLPLYAAEREMMAAAVLDHLDRQIKAASLYEHLKQANLGVDPSAAMPPVPPEAVMAAALQGGQVPPDSPAPDMQPADEAAQLAEVLEALGVTPEDLVDALEEEGSEQPAPEPGEDDEEEEEKEASDKLRSRKKASKSKSVGDRMKDYIRELIARSRN